MKKKPNNCDLELTIEQLPPMTIFIKLHGLAQYIWSSKGRLLDSSFNNGNTMFYIMSCYFVADRHF